MCAPIQQQKYLKSLVRALFCFFCLPLTIQETYSQACIPTGFNGMVYDYVCPQSCSTLVQQIPHVKGTETYTVTPIPHTPYPWVSGSGTELIELYADDMYSAVVNIPFPFCFYGSVYNSCVVGSNGLISFDVSIANQINSWSLTTVPHGSTPQPIPYAGGVPNDVTSTYYPRASIMGAYHDIYPLLNPGGQRRVEYTTVGTAPCRKFVVSFYLVPLYGSSVCNARYCSQQIVLHENTGIIDVHLADKPVCNGWNMGLAILGIQNWNRNAAVAAPGKNCTVWSETATSYRFTPSGNGSRFVKSEMFTMGGTLMAMADTLTTIPGLLDIRFPNTCPPTDTTRFEIRTTYNSCNNPATLLIQSDTITTVRDNNLEATAVSTNSSCGPPSGTITVTVPPGAGVPPFSYVLDGGTPVTAGPAYTFTGVLHGAHTVQVYDANGPVNGCNSTIQLTVGRNNGILANTTTTPTYCAGSASGSVTITVNNGAGPYLFFLDGGTMIFTGASPHTFNGLSSGTHNVVITDATGCMSNPVLFTVTDGPGVSGNSTATGTSCPGATNGTITVTATAGFAPFRFILDGGTPQSGSSPFTFTNVSAGAHVVTIEDNVGCSLPINTNVPEGPVLTASNTPFATSCNGAMDGSIRVTALSGIAPYSFSIDALAPVTGASPYLFTGQNSGLHTIQVFDGAGCVSAIYSVTVPIGPDLITTAVKTDVLCNGDASGVITVAQPATGLPPFQYSLDGINWQAGRVFSGLSAGNYAVQFRSSDGCTGNLPVTITQPPQLNVALAATAAVCNGETNGTITATATGGVGPYQYSVNAGANWQNSNFFATGAGNYSIWTRDANGCIRAATIQVTEPALLIANAANTDASCDGGNDGRIVVTASGGNGTYQYSIDGLNYQFSNTFNTGPGNFTVYVRDNRGCNTSFTTSVGLNFNLFLQPQPDPTICQGSSFKFRPVSNASSYTWSPATHLDFPLVASPVANPMDTTIYYLTAVLGRCTLYDTVRLNVIRAPVPDAGPDGIVCYGQSYTLLGSGGIAFSWSPAIYLNSPAGANPVSTPTQNTTYHLTVTDAYGCQSLFTDSVSVQVKRIMAVQTYPFDTIVAPGVQVPLLAQSAGVTYQWSPAFGLSNPNIPNPVFIGGNAIGSEMMYRVTATNTDGCKGEGYVKIRIHKGPAIYVPTAFTPNGDGKNDLFLPHPVGISSYNYFKIFNRWGQQVFSTRQLHYGWDGRINGQPQPAGTYVWMIEGVTAANERISQKGTITLIR